MIKKQAVYLSVVLLIVASVTTGCSAVRYADESGFHSSAGPKISVSTNSKFKYVGSFEATLTDRKRTLYNYVIYGNDMNIDKLLQVDFQEKNSGWWYDDFYTKLNDFIKKGVAGINGREYRYAIRTTLGVGPITSDFLLGKGIKAPRCTMYFSMSKLLASGATNNRILHINYFENIDNIGELGYSSCEEWNKSKYFNQEQKDFLALFENRARTSFTINQN